MEKCLRIALWMVVLTGCLQAKPVTPGPDTTKTPCSFDDNQDFGFGFLRNVEEVNCKQRKDFPSLNGMNMTADCVEVLACGIEGLEDAMSQCTNDNVRIEDTRDALKKGSKNMSLPKCERPKTSNFEDFVNTIETFVQSVKSG